MKRMSRAARCGLLIVAAVALTSCTATPQQGDDTAMTLEKLREARRDLTFADRGILANNDGCDCLYYPKDLEITVENFLDRRTTALADEDSQVGTIAYCTISSGFSFFTHDTKAGTVLTREPEDYGVHPEDRNATQPLIDLGSDCLQSVVEFGHANDIEVFWSMRMNDTHDNAHSPDDPYLLFPPLKEEHPQWLVGAHDDRTPHGRWSSVNYAFPEIRDLAFSYIEEVCRNYDVDGIELDFFRHLCYFKSVAEGGVASDDERAAMTDLMRRVREMTEEVGLERGRPILVATRVPDSVEFCREMGLELERWMKDDLVDIVIPSGYFRLNPWDYTVELAHALDVAVYAGFSESRVRGESRFRRQSLESYRGRAMNAWAAGVDGIYTFNHFNPDSQVFRQVGDPAAMAGLDKLYYATLRDGNPNRWLAGGAQYRTIPILTPNYPAGILPDEPLAIDLMVGEDFEAEREVGGEPTATLHLEIPGIDRPEQVRVTFNGHALEDTCVNDGWLEGPVPIDSIERGRNSVEVAAVPYETAEEDEWTIEWEADEKPQAPWYRDQGSERTEEAIQEDGMLIADRGTVSGDYHYYRYSWGADPSEQVVVEARVKVISDSSFVIVTNGPAQERLGLYPDHIDLHFNRDIRYDMDTTDDFHTYRIVMEGEDIQVYVDGELRLDGSGTYDSRGGGWRQLAFGAANSGMMGAAVWQSIRARLSGMSCRDMVLSVDYQ